MEKEKIGKEAKICHPSWTKRNASAVAYVSIFAPQMSTLVQSKRNFPSLPIRRNAGIAMPVFTTARKVQFD
jgi:aminopeptidase-like protein